MFGFRSGSNFCVRAWWRQVSYTLYPLFFFCVPRVPHRCCAFVFLFVLVLFWFYCFRPKKLLRVFYFWYIARGAWRSIRSDPSILFSFFIFGIWGGLKEEVGIGRHVLLLPRGPKPQQGGVFLLLLLLLLWAHHWVGLIRVWVCIVFLLFATRHDHPTCLIYNGSR